YTTTSSPHSRNVAGNLLRQGLARAGSLPPLITFCLGGMIFTGPPARPRRPRRRRPGHETKRSEDLAFVFLRRRRRGRGDERWRRVRLFRLRGRGRLSGDLSGGSS